MTSWNRICCAVDFSEPSRIALLKAAELAARFDAEVVLLHVDPLSPVLATELLVTPAELGPTRAAEMERVLALWRDEAARVAGRPVRSVVLEGDPAPAIVRFARDWGCDVLVIGTHARTGIPRLVLGSVAEKVLRGAPCTVLVARRPEPGTARTARRGLHAVVA